MDPQELIQQAQKKESSSQSFFSKLTGSASFNLEDAADLYIQAANAFRLRKDGRLAGQQLEKAASLQKQSDAKDEAANTLVDAYKAYRTDDPQSAARVLKEAIEMFTIRGQFRRAAQFAMDLATLFETDIEDPDSALKYYENAGDWFYNDRAESLSNKAFLKVAEISALQNHFDKAVENYERVARQSLNSNLSKWSLKDYFFRALFCVLAEGDAVAAQLNLEKYAEWDPSFADTKEYKYLQEFTNALKGNDEQTFTDKLYEYDQYAKLDQWKTTMGLKIKQKMDDPMDELL